jgi:hypothetical protein
MEMTTWIPTHGQLRPVPGFQQPHKHGAASKALQEASWLLVCLSLTPFKLKQAEQQALRSKDRKWPLGTEKLAVHRIRDPASNCKAANREGAFEQGVEITLTPFSTEWGQGLVANNSSQQKQQVCGAVHRCWQWACAHHCDRQTQHQENTSSSCLSPEALITRERGRALHFSSFRNKLPLMLSSPSL